MMGETIQKLALWNGFLPNYRYPSIESRCLICGHRLRPWSRKWQRHHMQFSHQIPSYTLGPAFKTDEMAMVSIRDIYDEWANIVRLCS